MTRSPSRGGLGGEQVEGRRAVVELLRAGRRPVRAITVARSAESSSVLDEIVALAADRGVDVRTVPIERLRELARTEAPQGVVARAAALPEAEVDELLRDPHAFLVALDGITDPQNLGAILRTAAAAGATGALIPRHRAARVTPTVTKAAAGGIEYLPIALVGGVPAALDRAARAGVWTVGLDADAEGSIFDLALGHRPVALVLGAEGRGLASLTKRRCDVLASIPMRGALDSLNVSAAAAVACFEIARGRSAQ